MAADVFPQVGFKIMTLKGTMNMFLDIYHTLPKKFTYKLWGAERPEFVK